MWPKGNDFKFLKYHQDNELLFVHIETKFNPLGNQSKLTHLLYFISSASYLLFYNIRRRGFHMRQISPFKKLVRKD